MTDYIQVRREDVTELIQAALAVWPTDSKYKASLDRLSAALSAEPVMGMERSVHIRSAELQSGTFVCPDRDHLPDIYIREILYNINRKRRDQDELNKDDVREVVSNLWYNREVGVAEKFVAALSPQPASGEGKLREAAQTLIATMDEYNHRMGLYRQAAHLVPKPSEEACLSAFSALRQALTAEVGEVAEWQPIEMAPKDGKWLLVWNGLSAQIPAVAYYDGEVWTHGDDTFYWNITHWMPLPAPPSLYIKDTGQ